MFLVYTPEGKPEQRWHYQPGRLKSGEMILLEKHSGGMKYGQEFKQQLMMGSTMARRALLWMFLHREHRTLDIRDVDFFDDELKLVRDKDETLAEIAELKEFDGIPEAEREAALSILRRELQEAPEAPGKAPAVHAEPPVETVLPKMAVEGLWRPPSLPDPAVPADVATSLHSQGL